jgi:acetyltransferase-like isoleucine patch superfamily enzyme
MPVVRVTAELQQLLVSRKVFDVPKGSGRRWRVGDLLQFDLEARIEPFASVLTGHALPKQMGAFSYSHSYLPTHASIGRYCSFGAALFWIGGEHPAGWATTSPFTYGEPLEATRAYFAERRLEQRTRPWSVKPWGAEIGHDVWIGDDVAMGQFVRIGHGAVIGARSLVLKDVPPYAVMGGQPARLIRYRFPEPLIERMLALEWWRYTPDVLQEASIDQPERFVEELPQIVERMGARPINPPCLTGEELLRAGEVVRLSP